MGLEELILKANRHEGLKQGLEQGREQGVEHQRQETVIRMLQKFCR